MITDQPTGFIWTPSHRLIGTPDGSRRKLSTIPLGKSATAEKDKAENGTQYNKNFFHFVDFSFLLSF
jgi:hypothetical protein